VKLVNLFGAPGVGKTGVRSELVGLMKAQGLHVEEIKEHAKYLLSVGLDWMLKEDQLSVLAQQNHWQLVAKRAGFDWAVTDSPVLLCPFYAGEGYLPSFEAMALEVHRMYTNKNFFLVPQEDAPYDNRFREPDPKKARARTNQMQEYLTRLKVPYQLLEVNEKAAKTIFATLARG
jgi:hypothetical protein